MFAAALTAACAADETGGGADTFAPELSILGPPDVSIGSVDDPDYTFGDVRDLALAPDGTLFSLHRTGQIRRWNADGQPAGSFGREGEGPGEFDRAEALGFFGDTLWVMDGGAYRVSFFDLEGSFVGALSAAPTRGETDVPFPEVPFRDGSLYAVPSALPALVARQELTSLTHIRVGAGGTVLDTIWTENLRTTDVFPPLGDVVLYTAQPFRDPPLWGVRPSGDLAVTVDRRAPTGEERAVLVVTGREPTGETVFRTEVGYPPVPLSTSRRDSVIQSISEEFSPGLLNAIGVTPAGLPGLLEDVLYLPDHLPPVSEMVLTGDGSVWLRLFDPVEDSAEWWVLDASGDPAGRVRAPLDFRLLEAGKGFVWGVETDDLDVEYIVRRPISPGGAAVD